MEISSAPDTAFAIVVDPEVCEKCKLVSRLKNGLCLNCLLSSALHQDEAASGKEAFKEALAAVKSRDGDWHIADHEILDEIGRGGMGVVYQAKEPHSGRVVALKCVLTYQGDPDQVMARFRREAETAARLEHPNIVPIYQIGETGDGFPFYTMKYAAGGSLLGARASLRDYPRQSVHLMTKVAQAVQYAHEQGVLHRDLKPGNIMLDSRGEPLVGDFGLARSEETSNQLTRSFTSFGTPGYIAPEQADGPAARLTPAADIYSLGAILFELLTGRPPFVGDNAFGLLKQSAEKPAPRLRSLAPHLDRDLETICASCLGREPGDRYQSAGSLAKDLQNWLEGRPVAARRTGIWWHTRRWIRDNRRVTALLIAFAVLGSVSIGWRVRTNKLQTAMRESLLASRSIAVAPFLNLDDLAADPILSDALAGSLQDQLNLLGPARVTMQSGSPLTWATAEDIRKAGQQAKARAVLTGTIRTIQGKKRISFRFVDSASGEPLFNDVWEGSEGKDAAKAATEQVGRTIHSTLSTEDWSSLIQLKVDPGWRNEVAREAIVAGRALMRRDKASDLDDVIALFRKAVGAEPDSSLAHAYLAIAATGRTHYNADRSFLLLGKSEAEKAVQLSPSSSDAHRALAGVYFREGRFSEALEEGIRAIEIGGPEERASLFVGRTLDMLGRPDKALNWYGIASRLARTPGIVEASVGDCWATLGDDEKAARAYHRVSELKPDSSQGTNSLSRLRLLQGNFEEARVLNRSNRNDYGETAQLAAQIEFFTRNFRAAEELYSNLAKADPDGGGSFYGCVTYASALGRTRLALGDHEAGIKLLRDCRAKEAAAFDREPSNPEAAYRIAAVEAALGMSEPALQHLREAATLGWLDYRSLKLDPRFDSLRRSPEFDTIVNDLVFKVTEMRSNRKNKTKQMEN